MASKAGGKRFSVDEYLSDYSKKKRKTVTESGIDDGLVEGAIKRRKEENRAEGVMVDESRRAGVEREAWSPPEKQPPVDEYDAPEGAKELVKSRPVIFLMYFLRAFAISVMGYMMLFVLLHDVMKGKSMIEYFSNVGDKFTGFLATYIGEFLLLFAVLFLLQGCYYAFHRIASRKWKAYAREELVYSIAFAIAGLLGSAGIVYALNLY